MFFQHAMSVVGIPDDTREDILSLMAALLHLGNVNFVEDGNYAKVQNDDCEHALSPLFCQCIYQNFDSLPEQKAINR